MSTFTFVSVADVWPVGTSVSVYLPGTSPAGGTSGAALTTAAVASDGSLTFTGLSDDTRYIATDGTRSKRFRSLPLGAVVNTITTGEGAPLTLTKGSTYFQTTSGVVVAEWIGTAGDVPLQVADLTGTPATTYTAARQTANDAVYARGVPDMVLPILAGGMPVPSTPITSVANSMRRVRCIVPRTGTLRDLTVWVGTTGGNCIGVIYDAAATRAKLWSGASVAVGASGAWQTLGDPNLAVTAGQQIEMGLITDSATPLFGRCVSVATATGGAQLPSAFLAGAVGLPKLSVIDAIGSYTAPATIAEASVSPTANPIFVMARIS